jgi:hypothetical protein
MKCDAFFSLSCILRLLQETENLYFFVILHTGSHVHTKKSSRFSSSYRFSCCLFFQCMNCPDAAWGHIKHVYSADMNQCSVSAEAWSN